MSWRVVARPDAQIDIAEAAQWYEARREGLGSVLTIDTLLRAEMLTR